MEHPGNPWNLRASLHTRLKTRDNRILNDITLKYYEIYLLNQHTNLSVILE